MDVGKQIEYWLQGAEEDLAAAQSLLEKGHLRHALFFAHLALEKALKAHVTGRTGSVPPRIHNLTMLAERSGLKVPPDRADLLRRFSAYAIEGRYPHTVTMELGPDMASERLASARETVQWLKAQL